MIRVKIFEAQDGDDLEFKINTWFEDFEHTKRIKPANIRIHDLLQSGNTTGSDGYTVMSIFYEIEEVD